MPAPRTPRPIWRRPLSVAVLLAAAAAPVAADTLPAGKIGGIAGVRQGVGRLSGAFGFGMVWGVQAGYQPTGVGRDWSLGGAWSVLGGRFLASDPAIGMLETIEMNFGLRVRRLLGEEEARFLAFGAGLNLSRTNVPVPPDMGRVYAGPYVALGLEQYLLGRFLVSLEARAGPLGSGPASLQFLGSVSVGTD